MLDSIDIPPEVSKLVESLQSANENPYISDEDIKNQVETIYKAGYTTGQLDILAQIPSVPKVSVPVITLCVGLAFIAYGILA